MSVAAYDVDTKLWVDVDDPEKTTYTTREGALFAALERAVTLPVSLAWVRVGVAVPVDAEALVPDTLSRAVVETLRQELHAATPDAAGAPPDEPVTASQYGWLQRALKQSIYEWQRHFGWLQGHVRTARVDEVLTAPRFDTYGNVIGYDEVEVPFDEGVVTEESYEAVCEVYASWRAMDAVTRLQGVLVPPREFRALLRAKLASPVIESDATIEVPMRRRHPRYRVALTELGEDVAAWAEELRAQAASAHARA